jgi:predicted nucleic-acid-binding protein
MIALDTNVVVRLLVDDDPEQCRRARRLVEEAEKHQEPLWLCDIVMCETIWVLESYYDLGRDSIAPALKRLVRARQVVLQSSDQVAAALTAYSDGSADFADYLILEHAKAAGCDRLVTFDRGLHGLARVGKP